MQQGLKSSIAGVVAAATLLAGGILTVPHAMALEADGQYYSSKQPYVAPSEATTASYSQAPEGYETVYTESMARHGSRGLSSYKYDALLMKMAEAAEADNGFKSDAIKSEFMKNLKAITAANVENGYGMLTGQGADQHQGIGARAYERNKTLFDNAAKDGGKIAYQSSGEARATESGENFARGFNPPIRPAPARRRLSTRRRTRCTSTSPKTRTALRKPVRPSSVPTITRTSWKTMRLSQALSKPSPKTRT